MPITVRRTTNFARLLIIWLAIFGPSPGFAISGIVDSFVPVSPQEAARWIEVLGLRPESGVQIKSLTVGLLGTSLSMTRIENPACVQDGVCSTIFKYDMGKSFEFVIPCKEKILLLDIPELDPSGKYVFPVSLFTAHNLTTIVQPSSVGPIITTSRHVPY